MLVSRSPFGEAPFGDFAFSFPNLLLGLVLSEEVTLAFLDFAEGPFVVLDANIGFTLRVIGRIDELEDPFEQTS